MVHPGRRRFAGTIDDLTWTKAGADQDDDDVSALVLRHGQRFLSLQILMMLMSIMQLVVVTVVPMPMASR